MRSLALLSLLFLTFSAGCAAPPAAAPSGEAAARPVISAATAEKIGHRIWKNECGGTVAGLTSWNSGENFASLGIGHFIWYPRGVEGPYEESFPAVVRHLQVRGAQVPAWLASAADCPWPSKSAFEAQKNSDRMKELRSLLAATVPLQTEFLTARFLNGTGKILAAAPAAQRSTLQARIHGLSQAPAGLYAMMDYVNFKGEGINPNERYQGQGWGLLQVLQEMQGTPSAQAAAVEFSQAARRVLDRRIRLAPKNESQWRAGWFSRCDSYAQPF